MMKVKPRKGLKVLDIYGVPIPAKGKSVPVNVFYNRLVKDGDLIKEKPKRETSAPSE